MDSHLSGQTAKPDAVPSISDLDDMADQLAVNSRFLRLPVDVQASLIAPLLALSTADLLAYGDRLLGNDQGYYQAAA